MAYYFSFIVLSFIFILKLTEIESKVERPPSRHLITTLEGHTDPVQGKFLLNYC